MSREPLTVGNYFNAIALVISYIFRKLALFKLIQTNPGLSNSSVKAIFFFVVLIRFSGQSYLSRHFTAIDKFPSFLPRSFFMMVVNVSFFHCFHLNAGQTFNLWVKAKCLVVIFVAYKTYLMSVRMLSLTPCTKHQQSTILCSSAKVGSSFEYFSSDIIINSYCLFYS